MKSALVSIIVPVYNVERFLRDCIESVLAQDYTCWELLLVDDGSTDCSGKICDDYSLKDDRIRVYHKQNGGLSSSRNVGIDNSNGDYLIFLDSDDFWCDCKFLEELVEVALLNNVDIVRGELREVDEAGKSIDGYRVPHSRTRNSYRILNSGDFLENIMCRDFFVVLSLFKRSILLNVRFNETYKFQEDIEFHIRLFVNNYKCIYIPICFYAYRKRACSLTTEMNINKLKFSFLLADVYDEYSKIVLDCKVREIYREKSVMMYYWTLGSLSEDPYYQHRFSIIRELNLRERQAKTKACVFNNHIWNKALLFVCVAPQIGVCLMRLKNQIVSFLYNFIPK